jgi:hypothetical protein
MNRYPFAKKKKEYLFTIYTKLETIPRKNMYRGTQVAQNSNLVKLDAEIKSCNFDLSVWIVNLHFLQKKTISNTVKQVLFKYYI